MINNRNMAIIDALFRTAINVLFCIALSHTYLRGVLVIGVIITTVLNCVSLHRILHGKELAHNKFNFVMWVFIIPSMMSISIIGNTPISPYGYITILIAFLYSIILCIGYNIFAKINLDSVFLLLFLKSIIYLLAVVMVIAAIDVLWIKIPLIFVAYIGYIIDAIFVLRGDTWNANHGKPKSSSSETLPAISEVTSLYLYADDVPEITDKIVRCAKCGRNVKKCDTFDVELLPTVFDFEPSGYTIQCTPCYNGDDPTEYSGIEDELQIPNYFSKCERCHEKVPLWFMESIITDDDDDEPYAIRTCGVCDPGFPFYPKDGETEDEYVERYKTYKKERDSYKPEEVDVVAEPETKQGNKE